MLGGLMALALIPPSLQARDNLQSAGNSQFEIVGLHARSVSYVEDLSQHIAQVAGRYLDSEGLQFPQRILVSLKAADYVDFEGDYSVKVANRGFVNLDLRWEESLTLRKTCLALAEALMVRYSIFNYGEEGPGFLPEWPASAIGMKAYLSLRPAQSRRLGNWLKPAATPSVESLLRRNWKDRAPDANGFALLLAMEQGGVERARIRNLMKQSLAGIDISGSLASLVQPTDPAAENLSLDDWWRASLTRMLRPPRELMESMESSRLWIGALADFSNTEFKDQNLIEMWDERENGELRKLIEARYEILRLRILQVNPAYFNAARSLGALFETYLSGGRRHKYMHRLTAFLGDFEDSKVLEEVVAGALDEAGAKASDE